MSSLEPLLSAIFYLGYFVECKVPLTAKGFAALCTTKKEKTLPVKLTNAFLSLIIFILYLLKELFWT